MALNGTAEERANRAAQELQIKIGLEPQIRTGMTAVFDRMAREFQRQYSQTGNVISMGQFAPDVAEVLEAGYQNAITQFASIMIEHVQDNIDDDTDILVSAIVALAQSQGITVDEQISIISEQLDIQLDAFTQDSIAFATQKIIDTSQKDINKSVEDAVDEVSEANKSYYQKTILDDIAAAAAANFRVFFPARAALIATTEVQNSVEGAKFIEADTFQGVINNLGIVGGTPVTAVKEWHTVGDDLVREPHKNADLQRQNIRDNFEVGGEFLKNPGDRSLGASPWNTINCRCSGVYFHEGEVQRVVTA